MNSTPENTPDKDPEAQTSAKQGVPSPAELVSDVLKEAREVLSAAVSTDAYARTSFDTGAPLGLDTEAMPARFLFEADAEANDPADREHVTPYIWKRPERFGATYIDRSPDRRSWRLTLDEKPDYKLISEIYRVLGDRDPPFGFDAVEALLLAEPELLAINRSVTHTPMPEISEIGRGVAKDAI